MRRRVPPPSLTEAFALARLRVACWAALKGWGSVQEDGVFRTHNAGELRERADDMAMWAMRQDNFSFENPNAVEIPDSAYAPWFDVNQSA